MIHLEKNSVIYILCPSVKYTGGPLALHQLGFKLINAGFNVYMYYQPETKNPVNDNFKKFKIPYTFSVNDDSKNLLIVPETLTRHLFYFRKIRKAIWWLSIDNFYKTTLKNTLGRLLRVIKKFSFKNADKYYHFTQSRYAYEYLKEKQKISTDKLYMLSDYLFEEFLTNVNYDLNKKENIVLYNPKKGFEFTHKLISRSKMKIKWVPIENMTSSEVKDSLLKAKIYIDFGKHPGKDRFPREAAICGCCVITGKNGAAAYHEDIPIPKEFKFSDEEAEINAILEKIHFILNNYESEQQKFRKYIDIILSQEKIFEKEINKIFLMN